MPVIIKRENQLGNALMAGAQGFMQGQEMKRQRKRTALEDAKFQAEIAELERKTHALDAPIEDPNYFRDPVTQKLIKRTLRGGSGLMNPNLTPSKYDAYGNPVAYQDYTTQPSSGDAASKYQAGIQGGENAQDLINQFGFQIDNSGKVSAPNFLRKKVKLAAAQFPGLPGLPGVISGGAQLIAGDEGKKLDLALTTLAKNVYRSETGAAGNTGEIENVKRRLQTRMTDSERVALDRILSSEGFVRGVAESIKPGTTRPPVVPSGGGQVMQDAQGNRAVVYPDGRVQEI